jgi:hypothetical protein
VRGCVVRLSPSALLPRRHVPHLAIGDALVSRGAVSTAGWRRFRPIARPAQPISRYVLATHWRVRVQQCSRDAVYARIHKSRIDK